MYDFMDGPPRIKISVQELYRCTTLERLEYIRIRFFAFSPEDIEQREILIEKERLEEEERKKFQEKMRRQGNNTSRLMSLQQSQRHYERQNMQRRNRYDSDSDDDHNRYRTSNYDYEDDY